MPEITKTSEELEKDAQKILDGATEEVLSRGKKDPFEGEEEELDYELSRILRYFPFVKTFTDPETLPTAKKDRIPVGTIIFRENTTPRRIYFKTPSALYKLIVSGSTGSAVGPGAHTHSVSISVDFQAI